MPCAVGYVEYTAKRILMTTDPHERTREVLGVRQRPYGLAVSMHDDGLSVH